MPNDCCRRIFVAASVWTIGALVVANGCGRAAKTPPSSDQHARTAAAAEAKPNSDGSASNGSRNGSRNDPSSVDAVPADLFAGLPGTETTP
ncbi:MAG: hypothetical protein KDA62_08060, partial [Planctomycetales bacterium]|nr:hypothetical protein [Planctomycetales bacterium]